MPNSLTLIVFGATGDLYQNKLSLALFNLFSLGFLPPKFKIIGFTRRPLTDLEFQNFTRDAIMGHLHNVSASQGKNLDDFLKHLKYIQGNLEVLEDFKELNRKLATADEQQGICTNKLFYLAVPPSLYEVIFKNISRAGLTIPCAPGVKEKKTAWTRVLVEKPFGKDILEAKRLDRMLGELFDEIQIFRIDHYLAKKTLQDIISFRFPDGMFESLWNGKNIETIRIVFHEENTVFNRGNFYDGIGALRDVGQNHMLQMLALIAMENPIKISKEKIHNARSAVLQKISLLTKGVNTKIVRGQYKGYLEEKNVEINSKTETFFRLSLSVDNKRWRGVRFELEAGKALDKSEVLIEVYFRKTNARLTFFVSSDKRVLYDAYEKVFYDCILGDQTIFVSTKEIMSEWALVTNIIKKWQKVPLVIYPKGTPGADI
ncbi:hypothetical protein A3C60_01045 [Candidatus Nomurabacteria bacterium RIFCSPHIGHO2_02_FULL_37_45]|uniref:Glucose-6-phosphate 1-dehydrogenase n=2 Tax=Candidatus Nomuraibacteriota TaxID=1752729 RepID=A0A1F6Y5B4_9BACT|nr:MAG: hypothetical protein A2727_02300 [Candidatus Nomurabacteria bacterium RIFCSPHIGHO2_01_FULL_37_110]OGI71040.1 MAG: hypothetical protein A3C60_01045 [Candidatus Nomurabacteria bacterium RIFCSPHIGHO2_02_FULL_37_45]OGI79123.1 MAG: hypothetical protein A3F19_00480 [Candidatus Nomurabacteria bacterium RIFCSPHIGHO2_12_FULL_37_29]OGI84377.1 MAG: hypothetical protein A3A92_01020 [Candidatus Nomurabacteria bacterium RIFCSPLOWO2_01_FULL_37_49]OGJ01515.1 MAG: hypothetical protein A3G98_00245 [Candi